MVVDVDFYTDHDLAGVVKLVDTIDSKSIVREDVSVQLRSPVYVT